MPVADDDVLRELIHLLAKAVLEQDVAPHHHLRAFRLQVVAVPDRVVNVELFLADPLALFMDRELAAMGELVPAHVDVFGMAEKLDRLVNQVGHEFV